MKEASTEKIIVRLNYKEVQNKMCLKRAKPNEGLRNAARKTAAEEFA